MPIKSLKNYFSLKLEKLDCEEATKSYIVNVLDDFKSTTNDLSDRSLTLVYFEAQNNNSFILYQQLADYLFWCNLFAQKQLLNASLDYYEALGRLSYWNCYKLIKRQWRLFEELSDRYPQIINECRFYLKVDK